MLYTNDFIKRPEKQIKFIYDDSLYFAYFMMLIVLQAILKRFTVNQQMVFWMESFDPDPIRQNQKIIFTTTKWSETNQVCTLTKIWLVQLK